MPYTSPQNRSVLAIFCYGTILSFLATAVILVLSRGDSLKQGGFISFVAICFIVGFWCAYFSGNKHKLSTLRQYLELKTYRNNYNDDPAATDLQALSTTPDLPKREEVFRSRANANIVSQGAFMAVVAMLLGPVLNTHEPLTSYQATIRPVVEISAMITITFFIWSIDMLDTAQNTFKGRIEERLNMSVYFFRHVGMHEPKGGASYRFYGLASLSVFITGAISFFEPRVTPFIVTVFIYLGYPVLFGYKTSYNDLAIEQVEIDRDVRFQIFLIAIAGFILSAAALM